MTKRPSLVTTAKAAADKAKAKSAAPKAGISAEGFTSSVHLTHADMALLRRVAAERSITRGGRPSVSDVIRSLIEEARPRLEKEAGRG